MPEMGEVSQADIYSATTGSGDIALTIAPNAPFRLIRVELHYDTAQDKSHDFTVTLNAGDGSAYDVLLYTRDLSVGSVTDLVVPFGEGYEFEKDDEIDVAHTNEDTDTYGLRIVYELI